MTSSASWDCTSPLAMVGVVRLNLSKLRSTPCGARRPAVIDNAPEGARSPAEMDMLLMGAAKRCGTPIEVATLEGAAGAAPVSTGPNNAVAWYGPRVRRCREDAINVAL